MPRHRGLLEPGSLFVRSLRIASHCKIWSGSQGLKLDSEMLIVTFSPSPSLMLVMENFGSERRMSALSVQKGQAKQKRKHRPSRNRRSRKNKKKILHELVTKL
ncbi:uncharacterized protein LOC144455132 [Phascolarctos cinereus]